MDKLKYVRLENEDGSYSDSIPLAVDSNHVDVNGNTLTSELNNKASVASVNSNVNNLQSQINGLASGSPLVASSIAGMTDTTRVYVNTTDGHWYWYNGTTWVDGGVYQSEVNPEVEDIRIGYDGILYDSAGNSVRGQIGKVNSELNKAFDIKRSYTEYTDTSTGVSVGNYYTNSSGNMVSNSSYKAISMQITNESYVYPYVSATNQCFSIYNSETFNSSSLVLRKSNSDSDYPTSSNPVAVNAGYYVVLWTNNVDNITKFNVSQNYSLELKDIVIQKNYNALDKIKTYPNCYINTSGTLTYEESDVKNIATDYIDAYNTQEFNWYYRLTKTNAPWVAFATYTKDKEFIERIVYNSVTSTDTSYRYQLYTLTINNPNVRYIRISYRTYDDVNLQAYLYSKLLDPILNTRITDNFNMIYGELDDKASVKDIPQATYAFDNCYPLSFAHRGYEATAPENTLPAFRLAKSKGYDFVECDLRFTSDDVCVLLHDASINRTARNSDGTELSQTVNIADITYEQALQYDFRYNKGDTYAGVKICTLEELLALANNIGLYIALDCGNGVVYNNNKFEYVYKLIKKYNMLDKVIIIGPSIAYIEKFLEYYPKFFMLVDRSASDDDLTVKPYGYTLKTPYNRVCISYASSYLTENSIQNCINNGLEVGYWLATTDEEMLSLSPLISQVTSEYKPYKKLMYDSNIGDENTGLLS